MSSGKVSGAGVFSGTGMVPGSNEGAPGGRAGLTTGAGSADEERSEVYQVVNADAVQLGSYR
ncbi:hypothetical protein ACFXKF_38700 [Streptomyces scopuliridis]|uniref:hypothetical protein n=1 Tax=Streptomyces scopuliridis TaxID=452529 RepID=UPI00367FC32A